MIPLPLISVSALAKLGRDDAWFLTECYVFYGLLCVSARLCSSKASCMHVREITLKWVFICIRFVDITNKDGDHFIDYCVGVMELFSVCVIISWFKPVSNRTSRLKG